jgi:Sulfotransferase family
MQQATTLPLPEVAERTEDFHPRPDPVFVVGMFRSGTSLLYALLNQHPQIALMYEGDLAHLQALFWIPRDTPSWLERWEFWNMAPTRHKVDTSNIPDGIRDLKTALKAVYTEYARQRKGAIIWGCKSPTYHDEVTRLSRTFPNARFIIIWRDIRHISRSMLDAAQTSPFFNRAGMTLRAILGTHDLKTQCDALIKRGGQVHQLNYEDMVRDPETHMRAICEFLEIAYDSRMSNLTGADRGAISDLRHHSLVKGEKILATRNGSDGIPGELRDKIERYVKMWRERYDGAWPAYPKLLESNPSNPSLWERVSDRIKYQFFQFAHHFAPVAFSLVPMAVWTRYRNYAGARRIRRLLKNAGPGKEELIRNATRGHEQLLKDMGINLDEVIKNTP